MFKNFIFQLLIVIMAYNSGVSLSDVNESINTHKLTQPKILKSVDFSFIPPEPFTLDYGMYCLKDSGHTIAKYFKAINIHFSRNDDAYIIEAPYLTYAKEADRFFRVTYENTVTHEITYGETYDLWAPEYNPQPYITRTNCFEPDVYLGNTYVMRLGTTVDGIYRAENSYYFQNLKLHTYELTDLPYNNVHLKFRQHCYCSGIATTTTQQVIGGVTYNVTTLGAPTISTSTSYSSLEATWHPDRYGDYFLDTIDCSGLGNEADKELVENRWQDVKEYYEALPDANKERIRLGLNPYDIDNLELLRRYDYCLFFKEYPLDDFLARRELSNKYYEHNASYLPLNIKEDSTATIIIIIASSIAILSITVLSVILIKKRTNLIE